MAPTLYDFLLAYHPAKARLMLIEKGVRYESRFVHLFNGESLSPAFLRENPAGTVPVLVDGANSIADSLQIVRYVDALGSGPLGGDSVDRAFVEEWADRVAQWDGNLFLEANTSRKTRQTLEKLSTYRMKYAEARAREHPELQEVYSRKIAAMKAVSAQVHDAALVEANEQRLLGLLDSAEARLSASGGVVGATASSGFTGPWLAGSAYSQADVLLTVVIFRIHMGKLQSRYIEPRPALLSFTRRVQQRPSWGQAFGPALSGLTTLRLMLPALIKASWRSCINVY